MSSACVIALAATLLGGCSQSGGGSSPNRPALESIFEAEPQLHADPPGTLALLRRLGADRVKVFIPWNTLAPNATSATAPPGFNGQDPNAYPATSWALYDEIVRQAALQGIGLDFTVGGPPPLWAAGSGAPTGHPRPQWRPSSSAFGAFMRALGRRYDGHFTPAGSSKPLPRVDFWSIWNEPNYGPYLAPQATNNSTVEVSPALYRGLLGAAWSALSQTGHGHDTILIGELAPRGITVGNSPGDFGGMVPLRFLRALYCADSNYRPLRGEAASARGCPASSAEAARFQTDNPALFRATGFALHPYPQALPPTIPTSSEPDYADLPQLPKLELALDQLQRLYGSNRQLPIYSTEFGYKTNPPQPLAASPRVAARYLNWAEYLTWRDHRVRSYDQYQLIDPPGGAFPTGLEFSNGIPKPSYYAYRMPLYLPTSSAVAGRSLEVWGCVRPAHYARIQTGKTQRVEIQFSAGRTAAPGATPRGFRTIRTVTLTDRFGYFDVHQRIDTSGVLRLRWSYPGGPTIFSRKVVVTIR